MVPDSIMLTFDVRLPPTTDLVEWEQMLLVSNQTTRSCTIAPSVLRARESQRDSERTRKSQREPERARESQREREPDRESQREANVADVQLKAEAGIVLAHI